MVSVAIVLAVVGVLAMVAALGAKVRMAAIARTPTIRCAEVANLASEGRAAPCEVVGVVEPGRERLISPFTGTPCVWYRATVRRRYHGRHHKHDTTGVRREYVSKQTSSEPLTIRDSSGSILLLPDGAELDGETETVDRFEQFAPHQAHTAGGSFTQRAIHMGLKIRTLPDDHTLGYEFRESVLQEGGRLYVRAGAMRDHTGRAWLQKPAKGPFLVSTRSEVELVQRNRRVMFVTLGVGIAAIVAGLIVGIVELL